MSIILDDFKVYTNAMGFVSNSPGGSSGNDLLISAEATRILLQNNAAPPEWGIDLVNAIEKYSYQTQGTYARPGWQQDQEQPDDYYGLAYISGAIADKILHHGHDSWWYFKTSPSAKWYEPMFWRWPALIAHALWAASKTPNPRLRLYWGLSVMAADYTKQDSCKINRLLVAQALGRGGRWEGFVSNVFWKKLNKNWGSMKNVYNSYYGPNHPITKWCKD